MSKRQTPLFLTQKEYDELLENMEVPLDASSAPSEARPVGRVEYNKRKYKDRAEQRATSKELL